MISVRSWHLRRVSLGPVSFTIRMSFQTVTTVTSRIFWKLPLGIPNHWPQNFQSNPTLIEELHTNCQLYGAHACVCIQLYIYIYSICVCVFSSPATAYCIFSGRLSPNNLVASLGIRTTKWRLGSQASSPPTWKQFSPQLLHDRNPPAHYPW